MSSLHKLWLGLLVATLYAPLRSAGLIFQNVTATPNSTDLLNMTVIWIHDDNPTFSWQALPTFDPQPSVPPAIRVTNSTQPSGSFFLQLPSPPPINLTLKASIIGGRLDGTLNATTSFTIPALDLTSGDGASSHGPTVSTSVTPGRSTTSPTASSPGSSKSHTDVIVGAVVGSVAFLLIAGIALFLCLRNRRRRLERTDPPEFTRDKMVREPYTGFTLPYQSTTRDSLSTRSSLYSDDSGWPLKSESVDA
ncbi:hypothetical protein BT96DRAFT_975096 [Gymnopus androsaceus JB14]|uniref:Mid2 domain-containing protein n=1 Tax=Gymnopus androsaceus JB14 TaxID=1447944 RepID=A0A6A4HS04_9AGAR|nr:hypothetical protein BT96DRAFT_975096 [Gymnopus androsaceus JB14]